MISRQRERELRETIRGILNEFDGGDGGDGGWGSGDGGYGYGGGDYGPGLYKTFLQPFVDVLQTSQAAIETAASKVQLLTSVATYAVMSSVLPFVRADYDAMIEHDKRRMQSIQQKYANVFKRTDQALTEVGGNYDGAGIFFVLFPHKVITYNMMKSGAGIGERSAKTLADTAFDFLDAISMNATSVITDPVRKRLGFQEGIQRLTEGEEDSNRETQIIAKVMNHHQIEQAVENSSITKSMRSDGLEALKGTLDMATESIGKLKRVNSVNDIETLTGRPVSVPDDALRDAEGNIDERDLETAVQDIMPRVITQATAPFLKRIKRLKEDFQKMAKQHGVTDDKTFQAVMRMFKDTTAKLES